MQFVQVTSDVRLHIEGVCVTIERRNVVERGKRAGEDTWLAVGHYGSVLGAAEALLGRHAPLLHDAAAPVVELRDFVTATKRATAKLRAALECDEGDSP